MGAKSRNIANLRGKLPSWIHLPTSVALPFGVFEKVLAESINKVNYHIYALESLVSLYKPMAIYFMYADVIWERFCSVLLSEQFAHYFCWQIFNRV